MKPYIWKLQRSPITILPLSDQAALQKIICQMTNNKTASGAGGTVIRVSDDFNKTPEWETTSTIYTSFRHEKWRGGWKKKKAFSSEDEREDEEWKLMNYIWTGNGWRHASETLLECILGLACDNKCYKRHASRALAKFKCSIMHFFRYYVLCNV